MPKYLLQVSFTKDGVKGLAQDGGSKRRQAVEQSSHRSVGNWRLFILRSAKPMSLLLSTSPTT